MNTKTVAVTVIAAAMMTLLSAEGRAQDKKRGYTAKEAAQIAKVYSVDSVNIVILKSNPPKLIITTTGQVTTAGWSKPELVAYVYIQPPLDGIYDFDFIAEAPSGIVAQVISPISVERALDNPPPDLRGVRIHGSSNSKEALFNQNKVDASGAPHEPPPLPPERKPLPKIPPIHLPPRPTPQPLPAPQPKR